MTPFQVLLSLGCLAAFTTSAAAECAWVLWVQETRQTQHKSVDFLQFRADKADDKVSRVERFDYVCLPDTVDPRGPKSK